MLGVYFDAASAQAGWARTATLAGASEGLEDTLWAARSERRRAHEPRDLAQGSHSILVRDLKGAVLSQGAR